MMKRILDLFAGKMFFQPLFEAMYTASVYGMNYGNSSIKKNGEGKVLDYLGKRLKAAKRPLVLFDVGANQGNYASALASAFGETECIIHAFEPSRKTYEVLEKNLAPGGKVCLHQFGFSNVQGNRTLFKRAEVSGFSSVYQRRLDHIDMKLNFREEISLQTIDEFCSRQHIDHIHFLKMDVEGHELSCLQGAAGMLASGNIDFIQFEFGGCNIDSRTYFQDFWYLMHDQYHFYRVVKNGLVPIRNYNERMEIFKNINFLLERKALSLTS